MNECLGACLARKPCDAPSGFHVDRVKSVFPTLDIKTDGVHRCPGAGEGSRYRAIIIDVCMHSFDAGHVAGKQGWDCIGMPASDASDETSIIQTADNAPAEKSGAAKYSHTRRHDAKVSRRLRLSYSHSTADQSGHRASQKAVRSAASQVPLRR